LAKKFKISNKTPDYSKNWEILKQNFANLCEKIFANQIHPIGENCGTKKCPKIEKSIRNNVLNLMSKLAVKCCHCSLYLTMKAIITYFLERSQKEALRPKKWGDG